MVYGVYHSRTCADTSLGDYGVRDFGSIHLTRACTDFLNRFGNPITMDSYLSQFLSEVDGDPRAGVKRLTRQIEKELLEASINAPNWYHFSFSL